MHAVPAHATTDTLVSAEYIDADGNGTVDHLKWTFDEYIENCQYEAVDWNVDGVGGDISIAITGINQGNDPESNGMGECDGTDPVIYISVTADAGELNSPSPPQVDYIDAGITGSLDDVAGPNISGKSDVVHTDGASGELELLEMLDTNANGQIDRIKVEIDNPFFAKR